MTTFLYISGLRYLAATQNIHRETAFGSIAARSFLPVNRAPWVAGSIAAHGRGKMILLPWGFYSRPFLNDVPGALYNIFHEAQMPSDRSGQQDQKRACWRLL